MSSCADLTFDPLKHEYHLRGRKLDNVTSILSDAGLVDSSRFTAEVRDRGKRVHLACQFLDDGDLDWSSVAPGEVGYVESWERYKQAAGVEVLESELAMCDEVLGIAGTLDRVLRDRQGKVIADLKTGLSYPNHAIQTALYQSLYLTTHGEYIDRRQTVLLQADGSQAIVVPHPDRIGDAATASAAITIARWRRQHGLTEGR